MKTWSTLFAHMEMQVKVIEIPSCPGYNGYHERNKQLLVSIGVSRILLFFCFCHLFWQY
jgi:hypothetical protein